MRISDWSSDVCSSDLVHAGHGLTYDNVAPIAAIRQVRELNIGHFLIGEAIFVGLADSVRRLRAARDEARRGCSSQHPPAQGQEPITASTMADGSTATRRCGICESSSGKSR